MDHSEETNNVAEKSSKGRTKRKWREIEALKERHRLKKELADIDNAYELDLEELEF